MRTRQIPLLLFVLAIACQGPEVEPQQPTAIRTDHRVQAEPKVVFEALGSLLVDEGYTVLFEGPGPHDLSFEWKGSAGSAVRTRSRVQVREATDGSIVRLRTSGYLPQSSPFSLGLDFGRIWATQYDPDVERRLLDLVSKRSRSGN